MSALKQRERSDLPTPSVRQRQQRISRGANGASPNPYQDRETSRRMPMRTNSHGTAQAALQQNQNHAMSPVMATPPRVKAMISHATQPARQSLNRSTSPSKYPINPNFVNMCPSAPVECFIPTECSAFNSDNEGTAKRGRSYGLIRSLIKIVILLCFGFGGGMAYNMYQVKTLKAHIDLESIPSVMLTDELVKKLAHDNQMQEQEIQQLKHEVELAKQAAGTNKDDQNAAALDLLNRKINSRKEKHHKSRKSYSGLRAVKRVVWDKEGHVQIVPIQENESAANSLDESKHSNEEAKEDSVESVQQDKPDDLYPLPGSTVQEITQQVDHSPEEENTDSTTRIHDSANDNNIPVETQNHQVYGNAPRPAPMGHGMPRPPKDGKIPLHMEHHFDNDQEKQGEHGNGDLQQRQEQQQQQKENKIDHFHHGEQQPQNRRQEEHKHPHEIQHGKTFLNLD